MSARNFFYGTLLGICALAYPQIVFSANSNISWTGLGGDLYFNTLGNWSDSSKIPSCEAGIDGFIVSDADYTIKIPQGGLEEASYTAFRAKTPGKTSVLDATGTYWLKKAGKYPAASQALMFSANEGTGHILTVEGVKTDSSAAVMKFSDGKIKFFSKPDNNAGTTVLIESGTLNTYDPAGSAVADGVNTLRLTTVATGGNGAKVVFEKQSSLRANNLEVNGAPKDNLVLFAGGRHEVKHSLIIGSFNPDPRYTPDATHPVLRITNGTFTVHGAVVMSSRQVAGSTALLDLQGAASMTCRNGIQVGMVDNCASTGRVTVSENASLKVSSGDLTLGNSLRSPGYMTIADNAKVEVNGDMVVGKKCGGFLDVGGDSSLKVDGSFYMGRNGGEAVMRIMDNASVFGNAFFVSGSGENISIQSKFLLEGGRFETRNFLVSGTNSVVSFSGGVSSIEKIVLGSASAQSSASTNMLFVSGGEHTFSQSLEVGESGASARFEMSGGRLVVEREHLQIGNGTTGSAKHSMKMTGGEIILGSAEQSVPFLIANEVGNVADVELLGGTVFVSALSSSMGNSSLKMDGVKLCAMSDGMFIGGMTLAQLGGKGALVDVGGHSIEIAQAFEDVDGEEGALDITGEYLGKVRASSSSRHAKTKVSKVALSSDLETLNFGRNVILENHAKLDLSGAFKSFVCDTLSLGEEGLAVTIALDEDDEIVVSRSGGFSAGTCRFEFTSSDVAGSYALIKVKGELDGKALENFFVSNPAPGFEYSFSVAADESDETYSNIVLNVKASAIQGESYNSSAEISEEKDIRREIKVSGAGSSVVYQGGVNVEGYLNIHSDSGASIVFDSPLSSAYALVERTGVGAVVLNAASPDFSGAWSISGGITEFTDPLAFGGEACTAEPFTFVGGTLKYSGEQNARLERNFIIATGSDGGRVVLNASKPLTLAGSFNSTGGSLVKVGDDALTLDMARGVHKIGSADSNVGDSFVTGINGNGTSPSSNGYAGLQILEGKVVLKGAGRDDTVVNQTQTTCIGNSWKDQSSVAELEIEDVTFNQGGPMRQFHVGAGVYSGAPNSPRLTVRNANVYGNTLSVGNGATRMYPEVYISNSLVKMEYAVNFGSANDNVYPKVVIDKDGEMLQFRSRSSAYGLALNRNVDVVVKNGGCLSSALGGAEANNYAGLVLEENSFGTLLVENGGKLKIDKITDKNTKATESRRVDIVFDGGILEMTSGSILTTSFKVPDYHGFTTRNKGVNIVIPSGGTHIFAAPFRGNGNVVKTGAGQLGIKNGVNNFTGDVFRHSGSTEIAEGQLNLCGTEQSIPSLFGAGSVFYGKLSGSIRAFVGGDESNAISLGTSLSFGPIALDVEVAEGIEDINRTLVPVARINGADLSEETLASWQGRFTFNGLRYIATGAKIENSVAYAKVELDSGLMIILR